MKKLYRVSSFIRLQSLYHIFAYTIGLALIGALTIYSYVLIDPNLTFFNNSLWAWSRELFVQFGYYQRPISTRFFVIGIILLCLFYFYAVRNYKKLSWKPIISLLLFCGVFSYPFLSHDFFNYMFDARIVTLYHQNPYFYKALDFPADEWLRFMHWTHRTYPYGPTFLLLTLIPSFIGLGKFFPTFLLFKLLNVGLFFAAVYVLNKVNKKWAIMFALHPLVIVEGLINGHNDMIALSLGMIAILYSLSHKRIRSYVFYLLSGGIKFMTLAYGFLLIKHKYIRVLGITGVIAVLIYSSFYLEIQPWYFLIALGFIPFFAEEVIHLSLFSFGLLLSYAPFVLLGSWTPEAISAKHTILLVGFGVTVAYWLIRKIIFSRSNSI